jgi:magnesium-transporting ATPase (P-type)
MTKTLAFIALAFIALVAAIIGSQNGQDFFSNLWSQIFWLAIGTLVTVFILESILENAELKRIHLRLGYLVQKC